MLDRLKRVLVESFVGAVALGYLLAQGVLHFVNVFAAPLARWISQDQLRGVPGVTLSTGFPIQYALPELVRFFITLTIWYILLRWLYFTPPKTESAAPPPTPALAAE